MEPTTPQKPEILRYGTPASSPPPTLNMFQKLSVFTLRAGGVYLIFNALDSTSSIMYSMVRGYDMSLSLFYPVVEYLIVGALAILFARPFGRWLGSGLGTGD